LTLPIAVLGVRNLMPGWATWPARPADLKKRDGGRDAASSRRQPPGFSHARARRMALVQFPAS
jgi:hypothetical protein